MPGSVHFSIDIDGDRELSRRIDGVLDRVQDLRPVWQRIVADWSATMNRKFEAEGQIEGDPKWAPLSDKYSRWKQSHFPGTGLLVRTGAMREAASSR